jgi:mycobactin lysine-N-oxygenase
LAIVGAGPKAVAIAAKAHAIHVLRQKLGQDAPEILIIERECLAAHWSGRLGYTDGNQILCTVPEKDVGFPYRSRPAVNIEMSRYSWQAFLIEEGYFSEWVDRGRPHPRHGRFAEYLQWVAGKIPVQIHFGDVTRIRRIDRRWEISVRESKRKLQKFQADGVVITGHGEPRRFRGLQNDGRILDGQNFWHRLKDFRGVDEAKIAVIGSGETAAAIVVALAKQVTPLTAIVVVNRQGTIFSRGESYDENKLFSYPDKWPHIHISQRREFLQRTDRGVFSVNAKRILNTAENVTHFSLDVAHIKTNRAGKLMLVGRSDRRVTLECDYVINATSFDQVWFRRLFSGDARRRLTAGRSGKLEDMVNKDLSLRGVMPRLHAPMLAALRQGPGFPNLTCLGLLSDRILKPYLTPYAREVFNENKEVQEHKNVPVGRQPERETRPVYLKRGSNPVNGGDRLRDLTSMIRTTASKRDAF